MSRLRLIFATGFLVASSLGVSARATGATDATSSSCGTQAWPMGNEAKGSAFVGRVLGSSVNRAGNRVYRFDVLSTRVKPAGSDGLRDPIRVELVGCARTQFLVGKRYLVSSSFGTGDDNRIAKVQLDGHHGVAWRVWPANTVSLKGYGRGTQWDEVPGYLDAPETLSQAVAAIKP